MSADNWGFCPRCEVIRQNAIEEAIKAAKAAYGKVPEIEYHELVQKAQNPPVPQETLREDYHVDTDTHGVFEVFYSCSCDVCGFKHEFKHEEQLEVAP